MIQRLKYQLIETYREIALIEDTDINLTGGDNNRTILRNDLKNYDMLSSYFANRGVRV